LTEAFLAALVAGLALHAYLAGRQVRAVSRSGDQEAAAYVRARMRYGVAAAAVHALILLGFTIGGGLEALSGLWDPTSLRGGVALLLSASLLFHLAHLPLSIWSTFGIEARFGFNRTTPRTYCLDLLKGVALGLVLGGLGGGGALYFMRRHDPFLFFRLWAGWMVFSLILQWIYPTWIAPLFWKFQPLRDPSLAHRIEDLLKRNGLSIRGVFVMDGTRRTSKANAFLAGLGRSRRVVILDTLIDLLDPEELEAVVAHELGHHRLRHIPRSLAWGAVYAFVWISLFSALLERRWFFTDLGVTTVSDAVGLLLFLWILPVFRFPLRPLFSRSSKKREYAADAFAAKETGPDPLVRALTKLSRHNATARVSDPLYSAYFDSHPSPALRVLRLREKRRIRA